MSLEMTHDDVRAALAAEALDALDGEERAQVRAHLAACEECRRELAALRDAAGALAHLAPHRPLEREASNRLRARLMARAAADRAGSTGGVAVGGAPSSWMEARPPAPSAAAPPSTASIDAPPPSATSRITPSIQTDDRVVPIERARERRGGSNAGWLAAAASLVLLLATGAYAARLRGDVAELRARNATLETERGRLAQEMSKHEEMLAGVSAPAVRVIELASTGRNAPSGRMFWDPATDRWTFFAHDLPRLRAGRDYQLWLITPEGPVPAGTFKPENNGHVEVGMVYDMPPEQLRAVAVTEEPEGGLPAPSGTPIILGTTE